MDIQMFVSLFTFAESFSCWKCETVAVAWKKLINFHDPLSLWSVCKSSLFSPELILLHMEIYYMYDNKIVGASLGGRKTD